jgi:hypothetical protein
MALPVKTTADDVRGVVEYFKTKPTGATMVEARKTARGELLDGRKMSAYQLWGILTKDGDRYKLAPRGWDLARKPDEAPRVFADILRDVSAYGSALEWAYHQGLEEISSIDVAAYWHDHHAPALGPDAKDGTIRENGIAFFRIAEARDWGRLSSVAEAARPDYGSIVKLLSVSFRVA